MLWSKSFIPTLKETPEGTESVSHQLMLRAGLIRMLMAGVYSYLPLGLKVLNNIEEIIRQEMNAVGAQELLLPALQPIELWKKTGRDEAIGEVMIRFTDRRSRKVALGPTHEEVITDLVRENVSSYRQLPTVLYQIQTKFRDEIRPRFGVVRACEFIMKDAYSFDKDEAGLAKNYDAMFAAYHRIFTRCGLKFYSIQADSGVMGGNESCEFMVPSASGEDRVLVCPACGFAQGAPAEGCVPAPPIAQGAPATPSANGSAGVQPSVAECPCPKCKGTLKLESTVEVGHIFKLGTKYSESIGARFLDENGQLKPMIMGCYGIGVSRLIAAIIERNNDQNGIVWPKEIAPYKVEVITVDAGDPAIRSVAERIYEELKKENIPVLFDDRDERPGVKFKDADLVGMYVQVVAGKKSLEQGMVELKVRRGNQKVLVKQDEIIQKVKEALR